MKDKAIKVLLIEDDSVDIKLVQEELSSSMDVFFDLSTVTTLAQGIQKAKEETYNVILLDLLLPDSSGINTFIEIHSEITNVPIIILSGTKDEQLANTAVAQGAQDYLVKGEFSKDLLAKAVQYAIEKHKISKELEECKAELDKIKKRN